MEKVDTPAFFVSLGDHNAAREGNFLFLHCLDGDHCPISRVTIIGSSSSVQLPISDHRYRCPESLLPACKGRLLVEVAIEQQSGRKLAFDLSKDEGRVALILNDFSLETLNIQTFDPFFNMQGCIF